MEAGSGFNFPNMEKHSCDLEWSFFEEQAQSSLEFAVDQYQEQMIEQDVDFKCTQTNSLVQNPINNNPPIISQLHKDEWNGDDQLLGHDLGADFDLWNENPLLYSDEPWTSHLNSQILSIPDPLFADDTAPFFSNHNHHSSSTLSHFSDQTLDAVVQEGLKMMKPSESEGSVITENKQQGSIKSNDNSYYKQKVSKMEMLKYEEIRKYFDLPISMAAKELNVGLTVLKKRCRELNIKRWPHRKIKSLKALISNVKEMGMEEVAQILEEHRKNIQVLPEMELSAETKKLRQACFKANYKKRRALASQYH